MIRHSATGWWAPMLVGLISTAACAKPRPPALLFEREEEHTSASIDARAIERLSLTGRVARVTIAPGTDDSVHLVVSLLSTDKERLREKCIPGARLERSSVDGTLALRLRQSGREQCGETWDVFLPPRLFVALEFTNAEIDASGISGGLNAHVSGTGRVTARVDSASASVTLGVGDIDVVARRAAAGELQLRSDVGRAELTLHSVRVPPTKRAGASSVISTKGTGHHDFHLQTRVGNVRLVVN